MMATWRLVAIIAGPRSGIIRVRQVDVDPEQGKIFVAVKNNAESYKFDAPSPSPWNAATPGFIGMWNVTDNGDVPPRGVIKGSGDRTHLARGRGFQPKESRSLHNR